MLDGRQDLEVEGVDAELVISDAGVVVEAIIEMSLGEDTHVGCAVIDMGVENRVELGRT